MRTGQRLQVEADRCLRTGYIKCLRYVATPHAEVGLSGGSEWMDGTGFGLLLNGYVSVSDVALPEPAGVTASPPDRWTSALNEVEELLVHGRRVLLPVDRRAAFRRGAIRWWRWFLLPDGAAHRLGGQMEGNVETSLFLVWPTLEDPGLVLPAAGAKNGLRWAKEASVLGGGSGTRWSALLRCSSLYTMAIRASASLLIGFERCVSAEDATLTSSFDQTSRGAS